MTIALALSLAPDARASELSGMTASEFYQATYFKDALEHPQIAKLKSHSAQVTAVAHDLKVKPKELEKAISKLESLGGDSSEVAKIAEQAVRSAAERTRVKGKLLDVLVNSEEPKHVVLYVRWQGSSSRDVVKEASTIASLVSAEAPIISTLSLAAIHPKAPKTSKDSVWSGKISSQSMAKIQAQRIDDYGDRLYKGLFEGVEEQTF